MRQWHCLGTDLLPRLPSQIRSRFDATIILDGCLVRTVSGGVPRQSSLCPDRLSRACVAGGCRSVLGIIGLVCRARPRSWQLFDEAWRVAGLIGRFSYGRAAVCVQRVVARYA